MMGEYHLNDELPALTYAGVGTFPVYRHSMQKDNEKDSISSFLYFYQNVNPQVEETICPVGCWIFGKRKTVAENFERIILNLKTFPL